MTTIARPPSAVRSYIANFQIKAVCAYGSGHVAARGDPQGAIAAWWCDGLLADPVAREARKLNGDVVAAGRKLGVPLTPHAVVVERCTAAVARIEKTLATVEADGGLRFFNSEYKRRRLAAQVAGKGFMRYAVARARLAEVLGRVPAGRVSPAIIEEVFGHEAQQKRPRIHEAA